MYRENAKKTNDINIQCDFAMFLVEAGGSDNLLEAEKILKQVAVRGHGESQYYLGNMYANGMLNKKHRGQPEFEKAFPLFVQSAKHHHPDAAYRYLSYFFWGITLFSMEPNKYCHDDA
jgi:TPR repeat protein